MSQRIKSWSDIGFRTEMTADGSLTLRLLKSLREDRPDGEAMHHSGGAAAETDLIYGNCIRAVFAIVEKPSFLSVGLGLGYNEMFIARIALELGQEVSEIRSFESVEGLRELFFMWLHDYELPEEILSVYENALSFVLKDTTLTKPQIQEFLRAKFPQQDSVSRSLDADTSFERKYDGILYDAFSSKTTPELWEEEFLTKFLEKAASPHAHVATYASKASLKSALKSLNFEVAERDGFKNKRNSLFAMKKA